MTYGSGRYIHKPHSEETRAKIRAGYKRWLDKKKAGEIGLLGPTKKDEL